MNVAYCDTSAGVLSENLRTAPEVAAVPYHRSRMFLRAAQVGRYWEYFEHGVSRSRDFLDLICL